MNYVSLARLNALRFTHDPVPMAKLWRWCRERRLPARKIGGEWFVDLEEFDQPTTDPERVAYSCVSRALDMLRSA